LTIDYEKYAGLICVHCIEKFEKFFKIREVIRTAELNYFFVHRTNLKLSDVKSEEEKPKPSQLNIKLRSQTKRKKSNVKVARAEKLPKRSKVSKAKKVKPKSVRTEEILKTKFKCSDCEKHFGSKWSLKFHLDSVHPKIKLFGCDICGYSTNFKGDLKRHMFNNHINPNAFPKRFYDKNRKFACDHEGCSKRFMSKFILNAHQRVHSGKTKFND
jgi:uncharacterized Zn-finger protein